MYYVKEIFKSIQGEGFFSGKTAIFVRFSGCNLWNGDKNKRNEAICSFCDTDFIGINGKNGGKYNLDKLVDKINHSNQQYYIFIALMTFKAIFCWSS